MASGLLSIAMTGINAAQAGLMTTSNNISNLNTEGYNRQRIIQASNFTVMTGAGGLGQGAHVVTVERMYSQALDKQVLTAQSSVSSLDTYLGQISQIDNMLADQSAGLTPVMQQFFDGIQAVASNPSSISARQSMVTAASTMVGSFQSMYTRLDELEKGVNSQVSSMVNTINGYTQQIGEINDNILKSSALNGQPANDLLDKRDQLVADLNKLVKVDVSTNDDGTFNVFVGSGQQLVVGSRVTQMAAIGSAADPSRIVVGLVGATGVVQELPESLITGGSLGGLISFRSQALDTAFNQLGLMAASVTSTFNAQHALGQDMLGKISGDPGFISNFFSVTAPTVIAKSSNAPAGPTVSASFSAASYNGSNFYTNLTGSDYQLSYDGANFSLKRLSDNTTWTGASIGALNTAVAISSQGPQGFTLSATAGAFAAGDSFLIQPTRDAARLFSVDPNLAADPRLIAAGTPARGGVGLTNAGAATVGSVSVGPGYSVNGMPLTLNYNGGNLSGFPAGTVTVTNGSTTTTYPITLPTDTVPYTSGAILSINATTPATSPSAISFSISGTPANGDVFRLSKNVSGVEDGGNIVRLGKLQIQNTMAGGQSTYQDSYAAFVNDIGNKTASADVSSSAQTALLSQATAARESVSGVNRDEEAAKLVEYQQAYMASAKVMEIASKLFDTLMSIR
ncbi:flagellar hook-associated protein FlgK [Dechloromonas sp. XY25]|uniref:Flagellar hook-associated protein 1 n=1 Tax=Dechloromonas hankyongensis TaxID=2908002 RepID=A0ABS9K6U4_9RHOO|nr:flagellar hook-associated protein FlgK [Dechloromonas hankyongensis]MCG2578845.1 flagellar hook-associated protein FlgK [Dechloromonas hankyongensis]